MASTSNVYGAVDSKTGLREVFRKIRQDVADARSRPALTELHKRAGYLNTLAYAPSWQEKFGASLPAIRRVAREEFARTARAISTRARVLGLEAGYDEKWGT